MKMILVKGQCLKKVFFFSVEEFEFFLVSEDLQLQIRCNTTTIFVKTAVHSCAISHSESTINLSVD